MRDMRAFEVLTVFVGPLAFIGLLAGFSAGLLLGSFVWNLPGWMIPVLVVVTMFSILWLMYRVVGILVAFRTLFGQQELGTCEDRELNGALNKFLKHGRAVAKQWDSHPKFKR